MPINPHVTLLLGLVEREKMNVEDNLARYKMAHRHPDGDDYSLTIDRLTKQRAMLTETSAYLKRRQP